MLSVFDLRDMVFYIRHHLNIFAYRMVYTTLLQVRDLIGIGSLKDFEIIAGKMDGSYSRTLDACRRKEAFEGK